MQVNSNFFSPSRLLFYAIWVIITSIIAFYVYFETKQSYRAVGFNDGSIIAKMEILKKIKIIVGEVDKCNMSDEDLEHIELIKVKAELLYLIKSKDGTIRFCQYD